MAAHGRMRRAQSSKRQGLLFDVVEGRFVDSVICPPFSLHKEMCVIFVVRRPRCQQERMEPMSPLERISVACRSA